MIIEPARFAATEWRVRFVSTSGRLAHVIVMALALALVVAGCKIQLAPNYDQAILDDLGKANRDALILFASIRSGTTAATFQTRARDYDTAIGEFDAVRTESKARANPNPKVAVPTEAAVEAIIDNISSLRDKDKASGVSPAFVTGHKQSYEIALDQAMTYEKALKR